MTNIIDKAMQRLAAPGELCKDGSYGDVEGDGPVCMEGALAAVGIPTGNWTPEWAALHNVVVAETGRLIIKVNDDPSTSLEDALLLMKKASALLDERTEAAS